MERSLFLFLFFVLSLTGYSQDISNKLGTGGLFTVEDESNLRFLTSARGTTRFYMGDTTTFAILAIDNNDPQNPVPYYILYAESGEGRLGLNVRQATPLTSAIQLYGSIATSVVNATLTSLADYNIPSEAHTLIINLADGSDPTVVLPPASSCPGRSYIIKRDESGSQNSKVEIVAEDMGLIDESTSIRMREQMGVLQVASDGNQWWIVGEVAKPSTTVYTEDFTPTVHDELIGVSFTGNDQVINLTLPPASTLEQKRYEIKRNVDGDLFNNNLLRIIPETGENLDQYTEANPYLMSNDWEAVTIQSTGAMWIILDNYGH